MTRGEMNMDGRGMEEWEMKLRVRTAMERMEEDGTGWGKGKAS